MDAAEFQRQLSAVADQMSATEFPSAMPQNDLNPKPHVLMQEIILIKHRLSEIEKRLGILPAYGEIR